MVKTAPLAEISLKYIKLACIWKDFCRFRGSATARNFRSPARRGGNSGFSFSGSCELQ